jgi:hypothetical protein
MCHDVRMLTTMEGYGYLTRQVLRGGREVREEPSSKTEKKKCQQKS